ATSAMLGLLSALCTRDRIAAAQMLDTRIGNVLRMHTPAHRREESARLLQQQVQGMTAVADRLQAMLDAMQRQDQVLNERLETRQRQMHEETGAAYQRLADSVARTLNDSVSEGVRGAAAAIQPLVETTMSGLKHDTTALHDALALAAQQQLDAVSRAFEQRSAGMVEEVSARLETTVDSLSSAWSQALAAQREANEKLAANNQHALSCAASVLEQHAVTLVSDLSQSQQALQAELIGQDRQRLDTWAASLNETAEALRLAWLEAGEQARSGHREVCAALAQTADEIATQARAHA